MQTAPQSNAMAEIALALAMAFFSMLVLTMVSMGAGFAEGTQETLAVRKSLPVRALADSSSHPDASEVVSRGSLVIFYRGRFFDGSLAALDLKAGHQASLLAVEPSLTLSEAMAARELLGIEDLTVTTLDPRWIEALEGRPQ